MIQIECFEIENPCKQICRFNRQHICKVCHRKRDEKRSWVSLSEQEKRAVLRKCHRRKAAYLRAERQLLQQRPASKPVQQLSLFKLAADEQHQQIDIDSADGDADNPQLSLFND